MIVTGMVSCMPALVTLDGALPQVERLRRAAAQGRIDDHAAKSSKVKTRSGSVLGEDCLNLRDQRRQVVASSR